MEDLTSTASNAVSEGVSTPVEAVSTPSPAPSAREAIERAFQAVDEGKPSGSDRARDEAGRFAKQAAQPQEAVKPVAKVQTPVQAPETPATSVQPPQRFVKMAQEAWAQVPEVVRSEVARMEQELTKGLNEYQTRWEPLKPFDEMARQGGTSLPEALERYTAMENMLQADPVRGVVTLCQNLGVDPALMAQALTQAVSGQQPTGGASPEVASLKAEIQRLQDQINGVGQTITKRDVQAQVEAFAKDKPRFDELSGTIAEMLQTGFAKDLQDAYDKAERLNPAQSPAPAIEPAPMAETPAPPQAQTPKKASLTITGSPASGSNPGSRKPAGSIREALQTAFSQVGG